MTDFGCDEKQHWAAIFRPFYLGKYEVTQEQWEKMTGALRAAAASTSGSGW